MTGILALKIDQQVVLVLAAMVLFTSFAMFAQSRVVNLIRVFAWQGALLAITAASVALISQQYHLLISALLTLVLKAMLIPWILHRQAARLGILRVVETSTSPVLGLVGATVLVIFCYHVAHPIAELSTLATRNTVAVSMAVVLLGLLLLIIRRHAMSQVVGFMSMENGLFFAALSSTYGMPMVVELGVAFDVLVAAVLFGLFFFQMRSSIDSLDVDRLNRLKEHDQ